MAETERRHITPAWPEDRLPPGSEDAKPGRPCSMVGYSRAGIAAEAGVAIKNLSEAVRLGRVDDSSLYQVVAYIAHRHRVRLRDEFGVDTKALEHGLAVLEAISSERLGDATYTDMLRAELAE